MNEIENINDLLIYRNKDGNISVDTIYKSETLWLSQKSMSKVFGCSIDNISLHLKNIFKERELDENSVIEESSVTASDGKKYKTKIYNLDVIISVGYRVNSKKATQFRIWATKILKEYMIKGVVMDDERLKNPNYIFGEDYFEEKPEIITKGPNKVELTQKNVMVSIMINTALKNNFYLDTILEEETILKDDVNGYKSNF